jgi:endoglucanase
MNRMLAKMQKFSTQGIGVIIGEYGVLMEDGNRKDGMAEYVANLLDNCDLYGYCPVLWDCNNLYSRTDCKIIYDDMAQLYQERSYAAQADLTQEEIAAAAQADMDAAYENADDGFALDDDTAMAWIMFNSSDWTTIYSVGDVYDPTSSTAGVAATDVEVTGEGTYTVSLDFTGIEGGYANSTVFCALAIANGETLYPGYCIQIDEITINGEPYTLKGTPYTTSDDGLCTRVNLYNGWVSQIPDEARTADGDLTDATPMLLDPEELGEIQQISVTFTYVAGE